MIRAALLGPPTAGKSTLSYAVASALGLIQISIGELLRRQSATRLTPGALERDEEVIALARRALEGGGDGFLLDGFPRTFGQLAFLERYPAAADCRFVLLDLPRDNVRDRFLRRANCARCRRADYGGPGRRGCAACGGPLTPRPDATEQALARKIEEFEKHELPIIEWLDAAGRLERLAVRGDTAIEAQRLALMLSPRGKHVAP